MRRAWAGWRSVPRCILRLVTGTETENTWISSMTTGWFSVRTALITLPLSAFPINAFSYLFTCQT